MSVIEQMWVSIEEVEGANLSDAQRSQVGDIFEKMRKDFRRQLKEELAKQGYSNKQVKVV